MSSPSPPQLPAYSMCTREPLWYYYIVASLVTFFGGLLLIIPARVVWYVFYAPAARRDDHERYQRMRSSGARGCGARVRAQVVTLLAGHSTGSKLVVLFFWLVNLASVVLYFVDATLYTVDVCGPFLSNLHERAWLVFGVIFLIHFILRMIAAPDKLSCWLDIYSVVDQLTVPHIFMGLYLDRSWIGLRFLRLTSLLQLADLLSMVSVLKTRRAIRLAQLCSVFTACWLVSSGFVFLTENNGDPFHNWENAQELSYWSAVYWLLVTMSTVGFGEIHPTTDLGRAFIILFIIGSFAMFTNLIPELVRSLGRSSKYTKPYKGVFGKRHLVVCGNVVFSTVCAFIKNFVHEDADTKDIDLVFINGEKPNLELEAFFRRHFADVHFIQGTVMDLHSCHMIKLKDAEASLIMADRRAEDPDIEDGANIMRAAAIKNFYNKARVIVQVLRQKNKPYLLQIPNWREASGSLEVGGDEVICISELKLGIMAQNCLAPGFSTMMSNIFSNRTQTSVTWAPQWEKNYRYGCGHEIYVDTLSPFFSGMTFRQVAEICFAEMNVLLLAIDWASSSPSPSRPGQARTQLRLNPGNQTVIQPDTKAYMFAQSPDDAHRVSIYKLQALRMKTNNGIAFPNNNNNEHEGSASPSRLSVHRPPVAQEKHGVGFKLANYGDQSPQSTGDGGDHGDTEMFDYTGRYHWCSPKTIEECTMDYLEMREKNFSDHVILCMLADADSPREELHNFVRPLRSSCLRGHELKDIVIIGDRDYLAKGWSRIATFPHIYVFPGNGTNRTHLKFAQVAKCCMTVILSAGRTLTVDNHVVDNQAILTTLNIRSMFNENISDQLLELGAEDTPMGLDEFQENVAVYREMSYITELDNDSNVAFLEQDDDDDPDTPLYMTVPYVTGRAFADSTLDSLLSCTFLSGPVHRLARALILGEDSGGGLEDEQVAAAASPGLYPPQPASTHRDRCHLDQLPLLSGPLEKLEHGHCYGELFVLSLRQYGFLLLGLYRLLDQKERHPARRKRFVITHPPFHFQLLPTDKVFVLKPFQHQPEEPEEPTSLKTPAAPTTRLRASPGSSQDVWTTSGGEQSEIVEKTTQL